MTPTSNAHVPVIDLIDRLCTIVDEETVALLSGKQFNLEDLNRRKSHAVLELRQLEEGRTAGSHDQHVREQLGRLQNSLRKNEAVLQRHLDAARQISAMLGQVAAEQESDGTYSPSTTNWQPQ